MEYVASAITAGSGQYREGYLRRGGAVADSEGILVFGNKGFVFFADSGGTFRWRYEDVASFKTGGTLDPLVKKFNVQMRDGSKASFRIGHQLVANAWYILAKVRAQKEAGNVRAADDRPWKVHEGGSEAEGFFVIGNHDLAINPVLRDMPTLYGPYSSLDDAEAVVAAKDPTVRPQDEELLRRQREETEEWLRRRKEEETPPPPEIDLPPPPPASA